MIHKAKKSMGQNFLKSQEALRTMCEVGEVGNKDVILEIGPGKGALTEKLLEKAKQVIAVEKDRDLIEILKVKFANEIENKKLVLIEKDILDFDIREIFSNFSFGSNDTEKQYKIIANIPYNITGAIFKKFLSCDNQPERMVILVQKEVAERIVARNNKESILSLSVKVYGTPKYIMKVHKRFFSPEPKVDSAIIAITNISRKNFKTEAEEKNFFDVVKAGFAHKRKVLRKNLENLQKNIGAIDKIFEKLGINPKARAEDVETGIWLEISHNLSTDI
jgi:16S rRNA (adenine1518-N6/adenine1519-N6)-dimethyltransferase